MVATYLESQGLRIEAYNSGIKALPHRHLRVLLLVVCSEHVP
ncbi:hypothetical protein DVH24_020660 [Malus domestica]|uniref:Uncharacterized protein n=1 Tax=Malus domestica TaxID=3750 RepID=A0A498JA75_MALDO|nr:hypothetical protein DVH24_020660 [Malus domestica]